MARGTKHTEASVRIRETVGSSTLLFGFDCQLMAFHDAGKAKPISHKHVPSPKPREEHDIPSEVPAVLLPLCRYTSLFWNLTAYAQNNQRHIYSKQSKHALSWQENVSVLAPDSICSTQSKRRQTKASGSRRARPPHSLWLKNSLQAPAGLPEGQQGGSMQLQARA